MADKKKKPTLALVISVGPKMKTKPTDAATPDMKKYGSMPMKKAFQVLKQNFKISNLPKHVRERNLPDMSPQRFINESHHRQFKDLMGRNPNKQEIELIERKLSFDNNLQENVLPQEEEKSEDEIESDMEEERQMQERKRIHHSLQNQGNQIPDFGDEDAREGELEDAERTRIMNQGEGSQQPPMSRGRGGMPVMSPDGRPKMPRDVFGKAWDMLKGERGGMPSNFKRTRVPPKPMRQVAPEPEAEPEIPTPQKVAAAKQQFDFINNIRRKRGEPPISIDEHLQQAGLTLEDYDRENHPEALK